MHALQNIVIAFLLAMLLSLARAGAGVYICEGKNWTGYCNYQANVTPGACYTRGIYGAYSFGPDRGFSCTLYSGPHCGQNGAVSKVTGIQYPGITPVGTTLQRDGWGANPAQSFSCVYV